MELVCKWSCSLRRCLFQFDQKPVSAVKVIPFEMHMHEVIKGYYNARYQEGQLHQQKQSIHQSA